MKSLVLLPFVIGVISLVGLGGFAENVAAQTARGVVFHDSNGDGRRNESESGIRGVCVSNGLAVVKTDAAGRYELPVDDDTIVFVIKPRDWMTRIDELHIPRFYYIHKPAGSPDDDFIYAGVEPTGPLPESIDFPLTPARDPRKFEVIVMGDPQPYDMKELRYYANDVVAELVDSDARFAIAMGDLVGDNLSLFAALNRVQAVVGIPWYNVHGNHDQNYHATDDQHADETFERVYGPANYAFQYGQVHFIFLDNVHWKGYAGDTPRGQPRTGDYEGRLSERQLEFVKNYVATVSTDDRIVVCTHIPLPLYSEGERQHSTPQYRALLEILSARPHTMSLSAHMHTTQQFLAGQEDGYTPAAGTEHHHTNVATGSGSWFRGPIDEQGFPMATMADGTPNGYFVATFDGSDYTLRYKAARMPADYQVAIHAPAAVKSADTHHTEIVVNVFAGNAKTQVRMRVRGHGDWSAMERRRGTNPAYEALRNRDLATPTPGQRTLPEPVKTPHLWVAKLPADLPPGVGLLEVEATDMFGHTDRACHLIEVQ